MIDISIEFIFAFGWFINLHICQRLRYFHRLIEQRQCCCTRIWRHLWSILWCCLYYSLYIDFLSTKCTQMSCHTNPIKRQPIGVDYQFYWKHQGDLYCNRTYLAAFLLHSKTLCTIYSVAFIKYLFSLCKLGSYPFSQLLHPIERSLLLVFLLR